MTVLIDLAIRSSVILAAGLVLNARLSHRSAALRHRVLVASIFGAALVAPLSLTLPEWTVSVPAPMLSPAEGVLSHIDAAPAAAAPASARRSTSSAPAAPSAEPSAVSVVVIWLTGIVFGAAVLLNGVLQVRRLAGRATRVQDRESLDILARVAARYGLTRGIMLARTASPDLLATWGVRRPQVLLPHQSRDWSPDRLHVVLVPGIEPGEERADLVLADGDRPVRGEGPEGRFQVLRRERDRRLDHPEIERDGVGQRIDEANAGQRLEIGDTAPVIVTARHRSREEQKTEHQDS